MAGRWWAWVWCGAWLVPAAAHADDLDIIRQRVVATLTADGPVGAAAPGVAEARAAACAEGAAWRDLLGGDGTWQDLPPGDTPSDTFALGLHHARIRAMALASALPGCAARDDPGTLAALQRALAAGGQRFCAGCERPGNWWWWNIGIPSLLGPALLLTQGRLDAQTAAHALDALQANVSAQVQLSGANLADHAMNTLYVALLRDDASLVAQASAEMEAVCVIQPAGPAYVDPDGIKPDFSFHQHSGQLYTGSYGQVFLAQVARYADFTDRTPYAMDPGALAVFTEYLYAGAVWTLYGVDFDVNVLGRAVSRKGNHAGAAVGALLRAATWPSARQTELMGAAKALTDAWPHGYPLEDLPWLAKVQQAPGWPAWPVGHRAYPDSDFTVHRRPSWYASVRMLSSRILSGENTNGEGKKASRQADGRLSLLLTGDEFTGDVLPAMDWALLPGITVERTPYAAGSLYAPGGGGFAGSVTDGIHAVAAMDFVPPEVSGSLLRARKTWVFLEDAVVFLAAGIQCPSENRVVTVVNQWPLQQVGEPLVINGQPAAVPIPDETAFTDVTWLQSAGIGYWLSQPTPVHVTQRVQQGRWSDLGAGSDDLVGAPIQTLWVDHGTHPMDAAVAYALVPGADAATMAAWQSGAPVTVLSNTADVAAVRDERSGAVGITFFTSGQVAGVRSQVPLVVWSTEDATGRDLWVADPGRWSPSVELAVEGSFNAVSGDGAPEPTADGFRLNLAEGRTAHVRLTKGARTSTPPEPNPPAMGCTATSGVGGAAAGALLLAWRRKRRPRR